MTNDEVLTALDEIKTYVSPSLLGCIDYVEDVIKKLKADGITDPINTDFTKLKK